MSKKSLLQLEWRRRVGGGGRTQRDYLDFVVDGQSLLDMIGGDVISCLGWVGAEEHERAVNQLLLKEPADLPNDRRRLYICPECGDLACGAITAVIERHGDQIIWRDFAFESGSDEEAVRLDCGEISFVFERAQYNQVLTRAL